MSTPLWKLLVALGVLCIIFLMISWVNMTGTTAAISIGVPSTALPADDMYALSAPEPTDPVSEQKMQEFKNILAFVPSLPDKLIPESVFEDSYNTIGPELMLDVLNENPACHDEAHNLGRVIYAHTQDLGESLAICQSKCTDGCIHGVLLGMFNAPLNTDDPSPQELTPATQSEIADTCKNSEILKYVNIGDCYHAVGHVLDALSEDQIPTAIGLCQSIFKNAGPGAIYYCATGVYMQGGIDDDVAASTTDKLYPCDVNAYPAACYRYTLDYLFNLPDQYQEATALCLSLQGDQQHGCFHGLGFNSYSMVYNDPSSLSQLCGSGDAIDKQMCMEGALDILYEFYPTLDASICDQFTGGDKSICVEASAVKNTGMNRDFALYMQ
jgi:hypothetical protein